MKNPVSGEVKELSQADFLALFALSIHEKILAMSRKPGVEAVVCFENLDMTSSHFGDRTAMIMGPGCTYPLDEIETNRCLGEVPSQFKYPVALWRSASTWKEAA